VKKHQIILTRNMTKREKEEQINNKFEGRMTGGKSRTLEEEIKRTNQIKLLNKLAKMQEEKKSNLRKLLSRILCYILQLVLVRNFMLVFVTICALWFSFFFLSVLVKCLWYNPMSQFKHCNSFILELWKCSKGLTSII